jgi:hypothetical protein
MVDEAVNFRALRAGTLTVSPVRGLRAVVAAFWIPAKEPKPGHATLSPFFAAAIALSKNAPRTASASFLLTPALFATVSSRSAFVMLATATS